MVEVGRGEGRVERRERKGKDNAGWGKEERGEGDYQVERGEQGRRKEGKGWGGEWKIMYWNITRLANKDKEFWVGLKEWDVVVLFCDMDGGERMG